MQYMSMSSCGTTWISPQGSSHVLHVFRSYNCPSSPRLLLAQSLFRAIDSPTPEFACWHFPSVAVSNSLPKARSIFTTQLVCTKHSTANTLPNRPPLHFILNPIAFYTQSCLSSSHDATYIPKVANLKPSVHSGPPCVSS